jgi:hypothetical protein
MILTEVTYFIFFGPCEEDNTNTNTNLQSKHNVIRCTTVLLGVVADNNNNNN